MGAHTAGFWSAFACNDVILQRGGLRALTFGGSIPLRRSHCLRGFCSCTENHFTLTQREPDFVKRCSLPFACEHPPQAQTTPARLARRLCARSQYGLPGSLPYRLT